jgi:hypothetical protein
MKRTIKLTERDLSRIVKRVMNEQDEIMSGGTQSPNNFCEDAKVDQSLVDSYIELSDDLSEMVEKFNGLSFDCDLDEAMAFSIMFDKMYGRYNQLLQLRPSGIDGKQYMNYLVKKYNII